MTGLAPGPEQGAACESAAAAIAGAGTVYARYLINLDRSHDRLQRVDARLAELQLTYERIAAVDGRKLSQDEYLQLTSRNRRCYKKILVPGEVGCYLSHVAALRRFMEGNAQFVLILEDDALLPDRLDEVIQAAIRLRERGEPGPAARWDVLKLNGSRRHRVVFGPVVPGVDLVEYVFAVPTATAATVWTRDGAARFLRAFHVRQVPRPIDCDLQHPWEFGLTIRSVYPPIVSAEGVSVIGTRKGQRSRLWRRFDYETRKVVRRLYGLVSIYGPWTLLQLLWHQSVRVSRKGPAE
ncbi:MAG: glycosyltransferase family 25 protein [Stenotrophobium sp.]